MPNSVDRSTRAKSGRALVELGELLDSYETLKSELLERRKKLKIKARRILEDFLLSKGIKDFGSYKLEIPSETNDKIVFRRIEN